MNPFEEFDLDPSLGLSEITSHLRERIEDAETDEEREALRQAWETLTRHPQERFRFALSTPPLSGEILTPPPHEAEASDFDLDSLKPIDFLNLSSE